MLPRAAVPWTRAILPFAGAYFLSYLFRTANGVIGPVLRDELVLSASGIGRCLCFLATARWAAAPRRDTRREASAAPAAAYAAGERLPGGPP